MARPLSQPAPVAASPLLTRDEVCAYLKVGRWWVKAHRIELGEIRMDGLVRYRREQIEAWLTCQQAGATASEQPTRLESERQHRRPALKHASTTNPVTGKPW